jgi:AcrR family transcriptional regulator
VGVSKRKGKPASRERLEVEVRRAQLLGVGLSLFSYRSYDEVSMDELAEAGGISKGLLYHYFPTKRDLYVAALADIAQQLLKQTVTPTTMPPAERVRHSLETYISFVERHGPMYGALVSGGIGSDTQVAAILERTRSTFVARLVDDHPPEVVTPLLRMALRGYIGFVEAAVLAWTGKRSRGVSREELITLLTAVLFDAVARGIAQPMPSSSPKRRHAQSSKDHRGTSER